MEALQISGPPGVFEEWKVGDVVVCGVVGICIMVVWCCCST